MKVKPLAERLRSLYYAQASLMRNADDRPICGHPRWDGGRDSRGVNHKPIWPSLAETADSMKLNPVDWVTALFASAHLFGRIPWPTDFRDSRVLRAAKDAAVWRVREKRYSIGAELLLVKRERLFRSRHGRTAVTESIAADPMLALSALVRCVTAVEGGCHALAKTYATAAAEQYRVCPSVYSDVIKRDLLEAMLLLSGSCGRFDATDSGVVGCKEEKQTQDYR